MPMQRSPMSLAATSVVPDPANGSSTSEPCGATRFRSHFIRARGFWVGWDTRLRSAPHFSQTFLPDNDPDVAGAAAPECGPAFSGEVPMLSGDGFPFSADSAGLPPDSISEFASGVDSLVLKGGNEPEVFESVVLFVLVDVVESPSGRDRPECCFPREDVREFALPVDGPSQVALAG